MLTLRRAVASGSFAASSRKVRSMARAGLQRGASSPGSLGQVAAPLAVCLLLALPLGAAAAATEDVNVALGRPCQPQPSCPLLVDGSTKPRRPSLRGGRRGGPANNTGLQASSSGGAATTSGGAFTSATFRVFLKEPSYVTHVIVYSSPVRGSNQSAGGLRRRKLVLTWTDEAGGSGPEDGSRSELDVLSADPSLETLSAPVTSVFDVGKQASAVSVRWGTLVDSEGFGVTSAADEGCSTETLDCDQLQVTEVEVLAPPHVAAVVDAAGPPAPAYASMKVKVDLPSVKIEGDFSRGFSRAARGGDAVAGSAVLGGDVWQLRSNGTPWSTTIQAHSAAAIQWLRPLGEGAAANTSVPEVVVNAPIKSPTKAPTTLAPDDEPPLLLLDEDGLAEEFEADVGIVSPPSMSPAARRSFLAGLPALAWLGILGLAAAIVPRCCSLPKGLRQGAYIRLPDEDTEALLAETREADPSTADAETGMVVARRPGQVLVLPPPSTALATPSRSRATSPSSSLQVQRSASEEEPEGELDPAAAAAGAGGHAAATADRTRGGGGPSPAVFGRLEGMAAGRGTQPQLPLPAVPLGHETGRPPGRVAMLFASPLCHLDPERGPTPLAAIPFEREWDMLVQAYNVAAAALREDARGAARSGPNVALAAQVLTAGSLQRSLAPVASGGAATVLHLSAHGARDCLVLEAPERPLTAHFLSCEMLQDMLDLRGRMAGEHTSPRLVVLNACGARRLGNQLAQGGIPHVVCTSASLRDSAAHAFLRVFYSSLFQGGSVARAFDAARVALRGDPDPAIRAAAEHFSLLPEGSFSHDEVLFRPRESPPVQQPRVEASRQGPRRARPNAVAAAATADSAGEAGDAEAALDTAPGGGGGAAARAVVGAGGSFRCRRRALGGANSDGLTALSMPGAALARVVGRRRKRAGTGGGGPPGVPQSPFTRAVPPLPEDFCGRALDAWSVMQHLFARRAVVVCAAQGEEHGVGKSVVLDAVHRAFALQAGGLCVSVRLRSLSREEAEAHASPHSWLLKVQAAVREAVRDCQEQWAGVPDAARGHPQRVPTQLRSSRACWRPRGAAARAAALAGSTASVAPAATPAAQAVRELIDDLATLADLCEARCREWPAGSDRILLLLDECDHLIQQPHFQEAIADVLQSCATCRVVLSTHQRMVGTAGGRFKVVHHAVHGLHARDAAQLFLRRAQRPLRWEELLPAARCEEGSPVHSDVANSMAAVGAASLAAPVVICKANEASVFAMVGNHPTVRAQRGNPRRLIELASRLGPALPSLSAVADAAADGAPPLPLPLRAPAAEETAPRPPYKAAQPELDDSLTEGGQEEGDKDEKEPLLQQEAFDD